MQATIPADGARLAGERRKTQRHLGRAVVRVFRDGDIMRRGLVVELEDICALGLGVLSTVKFHDAEQVKITVKNEVQRFTKDLRGIVRWQAEATDGLERRRVGLELLSRLTPQDLMSLKQAGVSDAAFAGKRWI